MKLGLYIGYSGATMSLPVEQVLLLYEPFAAAFPYESLQ